MCIYIVTTFIAILFILFCLKNRGKSVAPNFLLNPPLSERQLYLEVGNLSVNTRRYEKKGGGLSLNLIQRYVKNAYKTIAQKIAAGEKCPDYENWIYDNYYRIFEVIEALKPNLSASKNLPHFSGLPRLYLLLSLIVKSNEGSVNAVLVRNSLM